MASGNDGPAGFSDNLQGRPPQAILATDALHRSRHFAAPSAHGCNQISLSPFGVEWGFALQDSRRPVVLLVEDEALIRMGTAESLEEAGFVVHEAADGASALDALRRHPTIGVVITDIDMPRMDGLTLEVEVRNNYPHVRVVLVSGKTYLRHDALPAGVPFFEKPVNDSELIRCVRDLVSGTGN